MKTTCPESFTALFKSLSVAEVQTRLQEIIAEERAIRTLLRSLKARERVLQRACSSNRKEVSRA